MSTIDETLKERHEKYGHYIGTATISQNIKDAMRNSRNWHCLSDDKKESLEIIANKLGRILNGDSEYVDSWHDIIGYARLVEVSLTGLKK